MHAINILSTVYNNTVDEFIESYHTWTQTDRWDNIFVATQKDISKDNIKKLSTLTNAILINEQEFVPTSLLAYGGWITQQFRKLFFYPSNSSFYSTNNSKRGLARKSFKLWYRKL